MSDQTTAAVLAANQAFYDAFAALDIERMEEVWSRDDVVTCIHPGWATLSGWYLVMESWERIFAGASMMSFNITNAEVTVSGDVAWVICTENLTSVLDGRVLGGRIEATNVFRNRGDGWLVIHHHGSAVGG